MKEERNHTVYLHTSPSGKHYVGITCQEVNKRWKKGKGYIENKYFSRAIEKYGWDNIDHEIIASNLTKEEAEKFEILLIKELHSNERDFGYNIENGGNSIGKMSEEIKKKISKSNKGLRRTQEMKDKISLGHMGENNPNSKRVICEDKLFESLNLCANYYGVSSSTMNGWLLGKYGMPQEFIDKCLHYEGEDIKYYTQKKNKKVICDGVIYTTIKECAQFYNIAPQTMARWLRGERTMRQDFANKNLSYVD